MQITLGNLQSSLFGELFFLYFLPPPLQKTISIILKHNQLLLSFLYFNIRCMYYLFTGIIIQGLIKEHFSLSDFLFCPLLLFVIYYYGNNFIIWGHVKSGSLRVSN